MIVIAICTFYVLGIIFGAAVIFICEDYYKLLAGALIAFFCIIGLLAVSISYDKGIKDHAEGKVRIVIQEIEKVERVDDK